jgi:hypothetical protein
MCIEKHKLASGAEIGYVWLDDTNTTLYFDTMVLGVTAVDLLSFDATGSDNAVNVSWETAQEINNKGFNIYRSNNRLGPWEKVNSGLIPASSLSGEGRCYSFMDTSAIRDNIYYYKLEDVDVNGKSTFHGPVCVDWDGDGLPDDWELIHGFNPRRNNASEDTDGDGLTNLEEYERGTDPNNPDTDGDGIIDGDEQKEQNHEANSHRSQGRGVYVLASDETGMVIELHTGDFDYETIFAGAEEFERLKINDYVHGRTADVGQPELPLKGVLVDIPSNKGVALSVLEIDEISHSGYRVYPAPEQILSQDASSPGVTEVFAYDEQAYSSDAFYPGVVAEAGAGYIFRGQVKQQIKFYPLRFNPASGEVEHYSRIRVRLDYVDADNSPIAQSEPIAWSPPKPLPGLGGPVMAMMSNTALSATLLAPVIAPLSPLGILLSTLWSPDPGAMDLTAYKITLEDEGVYRIDRDWLTARGLGAGAIDALNLSALRLYHLGDEVAVYIYDQDSDDQLDAGDYIEFYGQSVESTYAKYTRSNIYWLVSGGIGSPSRMGTLDATPAAGVDPGTHVFTVHHEQDQTYMQTAAGQDNIDRWLFSAVAWGDWGGAYPTKEFAAVDFTVALPGLGGDDSGTVLIRMYAKYASDHEVNINVNGTGYGNYVWSGIGYSQAIIEDVDLLEGNNTVSITCTSSEDKIMFDYIDITYDREFATDGDILKFSHQSGYRFHVAGLTDNDIIALDVSDPNDVQRLVNFTLSGGGPYTLDLDPPADGVGPKTYFVLDDDQVLEPTGLQTDEASSLADTGNGADYILITHRTLGWDVSGDRQGWLEDILALREAQGLRVTVVDVQDIYDEFSYGLVTPQAIKDFLSYAYNNWSEPAPQYVLLVGDSSYEEISKTFLLFGDPAMTLKVPLPRRPVNVKIFRQSDSSVLLEWDAAQDSNGDPVSGYNVYRRSGTSGVWIKLNASPLQALEYEDSPTPTGAAATAGDSPTYYYAVTSVDDYGDESVRSASVSPPALALAHGGNAGGGFGGGACFVSAAQFDLSPYSAQIGLALGCLSCFFILIMRRGRSWYLP